MSVRIRPGLPLKAKNDLKRSFSASLLFDSHSISIKTLPIFGMYVNSIVFNKQYYTIGYTILFYRNFNKKR